jgi:proteasome accessory factor C
MARPSAGERLRRVLAMVPWIAEHDGPSIDDICGRFGLTRKQLLSDLDVLPMVGLYPFTPDQLVEVTIADDRVWIDYADMFRRPLRLTPEQAVALVTAGATVLAVPGSDPSGPLARGLAKLRTVLGVETLDVVDVEFGNVPTEVLDAVRSALADRRVLQLDYYTHGRDEHAERAVEPHRLFADEGHWYLRAWCRRAGGERVFRLDRVRAASLLDESFVPPAGDPSLGTFHARPDDPRVVIELAPGGRWVIEQYPVEAVEEVDGGGLRVTLAVSARPWFERLLLQLGPDARVLEPDDLAGAGRGAAERVLARYR